MNVVLKSITWRSRGLTDQSCSMRGRLVVHRFTGLGEGLSETLRTLTCILFSESTCISGWRPGFSMIVVMKS